MTHRHDWAPVRAAYDTVAADYAELVRLDEAETALDRALLDDFADRVRGRGPVLDAGCGAGRLTRHLSDSGVDATGVDLSPAMIRTARGRHPDLTFSVASLDDLPAPECTYAGVLAWYSVIHTAPDLLPVVCGELLRVLRPGGWLLVAGQSGAGPRHIPHAYGHDLDLTAHLYTADAIADAIADRGGLVHVRSTRGPEGQERRPQAFVLARRPLVDTDATPAPDKADHRTGSLPWAGGPK